jgi:hypothetical protein
MTQENDLNIKSMPLSVYLVVILGLLLSACNGIDMPKKENYRTVNGIPIVNGMDENTRVSEDVITLFLSRNASKVEALGCEMPSEAQPLRFATGDHHGNAYVNNSSTVINIPGGKYIEMTTVVAHELFHTAFCSPTEPNFEFVGWTEEQKNFTFGDKQVSVSNQLGFTLNISIDGKEFPIKGAEEMAASIFLRNEIAQFRNEQEGVTNGYGNEPTVYKPLFDQTLAFLNTKANGTITEDEMYSAMDLAVSKGTRKTNGFTIFSDELSNLIYQKGFDPGADFKQQFIETLYNWQMSDPSQSSLPNEGGREIITTTMKNKGTRDLLLKLTAKALDGDEMALSNLDELSSAKKKKERNLIARRITQELYRQEQSAKAGEYVDPFLRSTS